MKFRRGLVLSCLILCFTILSSSTKTLSQDLKSTQLNSAVQDIDFNEANGLLAVASENQVTIFTSQLDHIADLPRTHVETLSKTIVEGGYSSSIAWNPDGTQLFVDNEPYAVIWDYDPIDQSFTEHITLIPSNPEYQFISSVDWRTGKLVVTYKYMQPTYNSLLGVTEIIDPQTCSVDHSIIIDYFPSPAIALHPDRSRIAGAGNFCTIPEMAPECDLPYSFVKDVFSGESVWSESIWVEEYVSDVYDIAWSPDGEMLAISTTKLYILDADTYEPIMTWVDVIEQPGLIAWSADSTQLLWSDFQGGVHILDVTTKSEITFFLTVTFPEVPRAIAWDSTNDILYIGTENLNRFNGQIQKWSLTNIMDAPNKNAGG